MLRRCTIAIVCTLLACFASLPARAAYLPGPLLVLKTHLRALAARAPGRVALDVVDLATGKTASYDAGESMPAASTIKIPVMVEVFRQLEEGRFDLNRRVTLTSADKDWGWGELCDAPDGETYSVSELLSKMIDDSDNTAANMLIRLVGRRNINRTMAALGLHHTVLVSDIRTDTEAVRYDLRSSPADMARLLLRMAHDKLIDAWASKEMMAILEAQQLNSLIPEPLPPDLTIAHKTGSLHDTLNDVGVVYVGRAPYVIAVMTTDLPELSLGRTFIHGVSRLAYREMLALSAMRANGSVRVPDSAARGVFSPDVTAWVTDAR